MTVAQQVIQTVAQTLGLPPDRVKLTSNITDDLDADSIESVELILAIEDCFRIEVPDELVNQISTVQQVLDLVLRLTSKE